MDDNNSGSFFRHYLETAVHRVLPLGSASDNSGNFCQVVARNQPEHFAGEVWLQSKNNLIHSVTLLEALQCTHQHGYTVQLEHLLGTVGVHTRADAGRGDYRCVELWFGHCCEATLLCRGPVVRPSSLKRPKIILPAVVCKTLVTDTSTFFPIIRRALSTTTIVPSSR